MPETIPEQIGPYKIERLLGKGAMGSVYLAEQPALGRTIALKILEPHLAAQPGFHDRFIREARSSGKIIHPNVITCYDSGHDGEWCYMALELATGGDLEERFSHGPGDEGESLLFVRDSALGLQAITEAGLIHRDIKPANIFIGQNDVAKIADLGLARLSSGDDMLTQVGAVLGTPSYMSPEQAQGLEDVDIRSDIYALGVTLFRLLTGTVPFKSDNPMVTLTKVIKEPAPNPQDIQRDISNAAVAVINKAMDKDREQRYQQPQELYEDLNALIQGLPLKHVRVKGQEQQLVSESVANLPAIRSEHRPKVREEETSSSSKKEALEHVRKRMHFHADGLSVRLNLAPGASFPHALLMRLLDEAGVVYGVEEAVILQATRATTVPRRLVLAHGDPATPGFPGKNIFGEEIPALEQSILIQVSDDSMLAYALMAPGQTVQSEIAKRAIKDERVCFGLDKSAVKRLYEGPGEMSGRVVIARGVPPRLGRCAGFHLTTDVQNTTVDQLVTRDLSQVALGQVLATWSEAVPPVTGMDVYGIARKAPPLESRVPEDFCAEGVELVRGRDGSLELRAKRDGLCQQQIDGTIRVVRAREIPGDFRPEDGELITDDLVVVRGTVQDGAKIQSTSDVVIMGDLADADIQTGGSLQVRGVIGSGDATIVAGENIDADGIEVRRVMAGNISIRGCVTNSELVATGDIFVEEVVGGCLTAGGSITALRAGDEDGTPTELWAGHNVEYNKQGEIARITERKLTAERQEIIDKQKTITQEEHNLAARLTRIKGADFIDTAAMREVRHQQQEKKEYADLLESDAEAVRHRLARRRKQVGMLSEQGDDIACEIMVEQCAHAGVITKVANADGVKLQEDRKRYKVSLTEEK